MNRIRIPSLIVAIVSLFALLNIFVFDSHQALAGDLTLINNSGDTSSSFYIDGEPTLVMNGFDLTPLNLTLPVTLDVVTIAVQEAVPGAPVQVVVYEDANGGSPQDAVLVSQTEVGISTAGVARIPLPNPVEINAPVVWVGFYLPIGFRFFADESGSSVLTYWGWTPGATFNLSALNTAQVFGPADGSEPVGINMGGVARITAELVTGGSTGSGTNDDGLPIGRQIQGSTEDANIGLLRSYPYCGEALLYDPQDVQISAQDRFTMHCRADLGSFSPGVIRNADELPADVPSYERRGFFYEVFASGNYQADPADSELLYNPVTHCIRPEQIDLETAVIGIGYGAPREWEILPTQRYGELICAEVTHQGFISYFVPRTGAEETLNADLYFSTVPYLEPIEGTSDRGLYCGYRYTLNYSIRNEGFVTTPAGIVRLRFNNVRTGTLSREYVFDLPPINPGDTVDFSQFGLVMPETFFNETHRMTITIDASNAVAEMNENNNVYSEDFLIVQTGRC